MMTTLDSRNIFIINTNETVVVEVGIKVVVNVIVRFNKVVTNKNRIASFCR